jgi:hypothetical protein
LTDLTEAKEFEMKRYVLEQRAKAFERKKLDNKTVNELIFAPKNKVEDFVAHGLIDGIGSMDEVLPHEHVDMEDKRLILHINSKYASFYGRSNSQFISFAWNHSIDPIN